MEYGHLFEALMLVCFGFSWPLNVIKAYKARTAKGTSLAFIILIITGYVAGITAKFLNNQINYVLAVYFLNLAIVMTNVLVYIRNVALDNKVQGNKTKNKIRELQIKYKNSENYINMNDMEETMNYKELNGIAEKNAVILLGGSLDKTIPVTELAQSFEFNFKLYNRSEDDISIKDAKAFYNSNVANLEPEGIIFHIGEKDAAMFKANSAEFDKCYIDLIETARSANKKLRIALTSVYNASENQTVAEMNRHIKAIASSEHCDFVNLDNVKLWNPKATKASLDFAYSMGLNMRKPLLNVAEILFSYAYLEIQPSETSEELAG